MLGMDNLPQGIVFSSAVDVDRLFEDGYGICDARGVSQHREEVLGRNTELSASLVH